jgi:hypothetical protein
MFLWGETMDIAPHSDERYAAQKIHKLRKNKFTDKHWETPGLKKPQFRKLLFKSVTPPDISFVIFFQ